MNLSLPCHNLIRSLHHDGKNLADLAKPAAREKANQIGLALLPGRACGEILDHRMPNENRPQSGFVVELGLERKNAEHQVQKARHLANPSPVPSPNLGTNVINHLE